VTSPISPARRRLEAAHLYLVTPATPAAGPLEDFLPRVLGGGVDIVQLREKEMEAGPLVKFAEVTRRRTSEFGALFIINDRVDVALAAGADGVHLGQDDLPDEEARRQIGFAALIGLSTHSEEQVLQAAASEADYIAVGPVHETPTKPGRQAVGYELVGFAAEKSPRPFFAIGGIDLSNLQEVIEAGARRVAVLRALTEADDPGEVARQIKSALLG
jgi:thiamine-phosphate pyrophosphorylase